MQRSYEIKHINTIKAIMKKTYMTPSVEVIKVETTAGMMVSSIGLYNNSVSVDEQLVRDAMGMKLWDSNEW